MDVFNTLFNMSIVGTVIFLIFLLLKPITEKHFNSSWHYKMLVLVLFFFIIPVNDFIQLPIIPISNIHNLKVQEEGTVENENINIIEEKQDVKDNSPLKTGNTMEIENQEDIEKDNLNNKDPNPEKKGNQGIQDRVFNIYFLKNMIKYIWLIGMITLILLKIIPYIRFKSLILKYSIEIENNHILNEFNICKNELKINKEISLRTCSTIGSPMLVGIFNPLVLIPNIDEDDKRLKMIFLHELNHYKRKDILIKVLGLIINSIHWFNPFIYILLEEIEKYCEYSIDEKVVEEMDIVDRKYYGETILSLIDDSMLRRTSFTTAMGTKGKELKTRLENMIYSFKSTRKKHIISVLIGLLILVSGFTVACSVLPIKAAEENDSFVAYIKEDGLYYSYLNGGDEVKIHEGKEFSYPLVSKSGDYIAYTKGKSLYIYDIKSEVYEKITERKYLLDNFYNWIDDEIVYSTEGPGFIIYNPLIKEKKEHLDEYYYGNFKSSSKNFLYGKQTKEWTTEEGDFSATQGIVEIDLSSYNKEDKKFGIETIIEGKQPTDTMLGYDPTISKISEDGKYIFIMEKFQSGSISADYAGIGLYDTEDRIHIDFTDIYGDGEFTYGEEDKDLVVLPNINNIAINPKDSSLIGIIKGGFRERFMNKKMILLDINKDKSYNTINLTDNSLVAMTPSFTLDGDKILYSATKAIDPNIINDFNQAYRDWQDQPHNIYEYDLKNFKIRKLTSGNNFDFMPINISKDEILICRLKDNGNSQLIKIGGQGEEIIVDDVIMDHFTEKNIDIFINKKEKIHTKAEAINEVNTKTNKDILDELANKDFFIKGGGSNSSDDEVIIEFGKSFVNLFNGAVEKQKKVSFEKYISNKNLQRFTDKVLELTQILDIKGRNFVNYGLKNEFGEAKLRQHPADEIWYLELPFQFEGSGMTAKLLIAAENKALKLVDLYFGTKDGVDTFATGHPAERTIKDPYLWENEEWVKNVFDRLEEFEKMEENHKSYDTIYKYMKERSIVAFSPYYELLDFQISNYVEEIVGGNIEATFYYKIIHKNYDKDPDTVGYIKEAKENNSKYYQQMYDEYLQPMDMNFDLKIVIDENDTITLYSNVSPNGIEWEETEMSDFILKK